MKSKRFYIKVSVALRIVVDIACRCSPSIISEIIHLYCTIPTHSPQHNTFSEDIPVCIILKGLGMESDQEIMQSVGAELDVVCLSAEFIKYCNNNGNQMNSLFRHVHTPTRSANNIQILTPIPRTGVYLLSLARRMPQC